MNTSAKRNWNALISKTQACSVKWEEIRVSHTANTCKHLMNLVYFAGISCLVNFLLSYYILSRLILSLTFSLSLSPSLSLMPIIMLIIK